MKKGGQGSALRTGKSPAVQNGKKGAGTGRGATNKKKGDKKDGTEEYLHDLDNCERATFFVEHFGLLLNEISIFPSSLDCCG